MLSQALFTDVQRACLAAVQRVAVYDVLAGRKVSLSSLLCLKYASRRLN